ncbi:MAG TPA: hypothetical protein VK737_10735, partial [Opitutales bacterium]|nr:hypothetical protein [Opitutales bacterium]
HAWLVPPASFHYSWDLPRNNSSDPIVSREADLPRMAIMRSWKAKEYDDGFVTSAEAEFPVFDDASTFHKEVSARLSEEARRTVDDQTTGFVWQRFLALFCALDKTRELNTHEYSQSCYIQYCSGNIISVQVEGGSFPHTDVDHAGYNFINECGHARRFTLGELFIPNSGWEKELSMLSINDFKRQNVEDVVAGKIASIDPSQLVKFTVTPDGLHLHFWPSIVGTDCELCEAVADIPWAALRGYLHPEGPARFLVAP